MASGLYYVAPTPWTPTALAVPPVVKMTPRQQLRRWRQEAVYARTAYLQQVANGTIPAGGIALNPRALINYGNGPYPEPPRVIGRKLHRWLLWHPYELTDETTIRSFTVSLTFAELGAQFKQRADDAIALIDDSLTNAPYHQPLSDEVDVDWSTLPAGQREFDTGVLNVTFLGGLVSTVTPADDAPGVGNQYRDWREWGALTAWYTANYGPTFPTEADYRAWLVEIESRDPLH
ncbi:MAG TPA: hypothetical protein VFK13_07085 [Gemmatimonadaceae bacterium]|nr:hypothetical protein [Gemmatimonadaceae bacterium]